MWTIVSSNSIFFPLFYLRMRGNFLYKKLGEKIINIRKNKGITQEKLALLSDIDRTYLARIEKGETNPSLKVLFKICRILKMKISSLLKNL